VFILFDIELLFYCTVIASMYIFVTRLSNVLTENGRPELSMGWVDLWVVLGWIQQLSLCDGAFVLAC